MDKQIKSSLYFEDYIVNSVEFVVNKNFNSVENVKIDFDISHETIVDNNNMQISINLNVFKDMEKNNYPFNIKVNITGYYRIDGEDDNISTYEKNGLAILYPYIRSIVSTYTANSNVPTLILPPINIINYLKSKKDSQ